MRLNPFAKAKPDDLERQFSHERSQQRVEQALKPSSEEQISIEQHREKLELTKWQQTMSEEIKIMVHRLKNEILDVDNEVWAKRKVIVDGKLQDAKQLCTDECIFRLVALLEFSTSKNLMMSKYEKPNILNTLHKLADDVAIDVLLANRQKFEIDMSDMTLIVNIFCQAAEPTYYRALGANEKEYLKGIRKDTYLHTDEENKKKSGFLNL